MPSLNYRFQSEAETTDFARHLAHKLSASDVILLYGGLGAGKTHFSRACIQARMAEIGPIEDVPSPTFTLVQTYSLDDVEIWHADLYRLSGPDEIFELGLDEAFETGICLIEWPDRLQGLKPAGALELHFAMTSVLGERTVTALFDNPKWTDKLPPAIADG